MIKYYKQSLISLFKQVHVLCGDPYGKRENCLEIQERLIKRITYVETRIHKLKIVIKDLQKRLALQQHVRLSKVEAQAIKDKISYYQNKIDEYQLLLVIFRQIGDALAFIYFDKWDIKPLAFKQSPGFVSQKKGLKQELASLRRIFVLGHVAILNDLTSCLRYGDISIPGGGRPLFFEVKSSNKTNSRIRRQIKKARQISDYLSKDKTENLYGIEGEFWRIGIHSKEANNINQLNSIISTALKNGAKHAEVEKGLHYIVSTGINLDGLNPSINKYRREGIVSIVNDIRFNNTGYYPFTLSFYDPEALYEFYRGKLHIAILVDCEVMKRKLEAKGLEMKVLSDEDSIIEIHSLDHRKDEIGYLRISRHLFGRLFAEFISLEWLLDEIIYGAENMQVEFEASDKL